MLRRWSSVFLRIWAETRKIWSVVSLWVHRGVCDLGGVDGSNAAYGTGFVIGDSRTQEIGNGDGGTNKHGAEVPGVAGAGFSNGGVVSVKPDDSGRDFLGILREGVGHAGSELADLESCHSDGILVKE